MNDDLPFGQADYRSGHSCMSSKFDGYKKLPFAKKGRSV
jgi:hypothetical protein